MRVQTEGKGHSPRMVVGGQGLVDGRGSAEGRTAIADPPAPGQHFIGTSGLHGLKATESEQGRRGGENGRGGRRIEQKRTCGREVH